MREKLAITKEVSTIPIRNPNSPAHLPSSSDAYESSETTHVSSKHVFSSDASFLPQHDAATRASVFDIDTVGHPISERVEPEHTCRLLALLDRRVDRHVT